VSRVHANNFSTTLNGAINNSTTSVIITSATGFPAVGGGTTCNITVQESNTIEIMQVTAIAGTTLTVVRAREGTSASSFSDGSTVEIRFTRDSIDDKQEDISGLTITTATVATNEKVLIQDTSNSDNLKTVTTQAIADLATDAGLITTDVTTNNASTSKHGFLKKLSNTATEYMDGTGNWSVPAGGGGGGGLVLLDVQTASNSAQLAFTSDIDSTYSNYLFVIQGIYSGTSSQLLMQVSYDVGSTYANDWYMYAGTDVNSNSSTVSGLASNRAGSFPLSGGGNIQNNSSVLNSGQIWMHGPANPACNFVIQMHSTLSGGYSRAVNIVGRHDSAANGDTPPVDAVKFYMNSGNITAGTIHMYGLQKV
jgi:hypothetical protein